MHGWTTFPLSKYKVINPLNTQNQKSELNVLILKDIPLFCDLCSTVEEVRTAIERNNDTSLYIPSAEKIVTIGKEKIETIVVLDETMRKQNKK